MIGYPQILETLVALSTFFSVPVMIGCIVLGIIAAFYGYKLYKTFLRATFALGASFAVYEIIVFYLPIERLPSLYGLSWTAVIALVLAILCAIFAPYIYKFVSGAIVGASLGAYLMAFIGVKNSIIIGIVASIVAVLLGLLFRKIFKAFYIVSSSLGGMTTCALALGVILFPETFTYYMKESFITSFTKQGAALADIEMALAEVGLANVQAPTSDVGLLVMGGLIILGLIAGIVATILQFKNNKDN